jgi:hypothetical protein
MRSSFLVFFLALLASGLQADLIVDSTRAYTNLPSPGNANLSFNAKFNQGGSMVFCFSSSLQTNTRSSSWGFSGVPRVLSPQIELFIEKDKVVVTTTNGSFTINNNRPLDFGVFTAYNLRIAPSATKNNSYSISLIAGTTLIFNLAEVFCADTILSYSYRKDRQSWILGGGTPFIREMNIPSLSIKPGDLIQLKAAEESLTFDASKKMILAKVEKFSPAGWLKVDSYQPVSGFIKLSTVDNLPIKSGAGSLIVGSGTADQLLIKYDFINNKINIFSNNFPLISEGVGGVKFVQSRSNLSLLSLSLSLVGDNQKLMYGLIADALSASTVKGIFDNKILLAFQDPEKNLSEWTYLVSALSSYLQALKLKLNFSSAKAESDAVVAQVLSSLSQLKIVADIPNSVKNSLDQLIASWSDMVVAVAPINAGDYVQIKFSNGSSLSTGDAAVLGLSNASIFDDLTHFKVASYDKVTSRFTLSTFSGSSIVFAQIQPSTFTLSTSSVASEPSAFRLIYDSSSKKYQLKSFSSAVPGILTAVSGKPVFALPSTAADQSLEINVLSAEQRILDGFDAAAFSALDSVKIKNDIDKFDTFFRLANKVEADWRYGFNKFALYVDAAKLTFDFTNSIATSLSSLRDLISFANAASLIVGIPAIVKTNLLSLASGLTSLEPAALPIKNGDILQIKFSDGNLLSINESTGQLIARKASTFDELTHFKVVDYEAEALKIRFRASSNNASIRSAGGLLGLGSQSSEPSEFYLSYNSISKKYKLRSSERNFVSISQGKVQLSATALEANTLLDITVLTPNHSLLDGLSFASLDFDKLKSDIDFKFNVLFGLSGISDDDLNYFVDSFVKYLRVVRSKLDFKNAMAMSNQILTLLLTAINQINLIPRITDAAKSKLIETAALLVSLRPSVAAINDNDVVQIKLSSRFFLSLAAGSTTVMSKETNSYDVDTFFRVKKYDKDAGRITLKTLDDKSIGILETKLSSLSEVSPAAEFLLEVDSSKDAMTLALVSSPKLYIYINQQQQVYFTTVSRSQALLLEKVSLAKQALLGLKVTNLTSSDVFSAIQDRFIKALDVAGNTATESTYLADELVKYLQLAIKENDIKASFTQKQAGQSLSCYEILIKFVETLKTKSSFPGSSISIIMAFLRNSFPTDLVFFDSLTQKNEMTASLVASDFKDKILPFIDSLSSSKTFSASFLNSFGIYLSSAREKLGDLNLIQLPALGGSGYTVDTYSLTFLKFLTHPNASNSDSVIAAARKLLDSLFSSVKVSSIANFYTFDCPANSKVVLRFDANNKNMVLKNIDGKLVGELSSLNSMKESHFTIVSYNKETSSIFFKEVLLNAPITAEPVLVNNKFLMALKNDKNEYLSTLSSSDNAVQLSFSTANAKVLFDIIKLDPLDYLFDSLVVPSKTDEVISVLMLFVQGFDLLKVRASRQSEVFLIFKSFVEATIKSSLANAVIVDGLTAIDLIRQLIYVLASQAYLSEGIKTELLALLAQNQFSLGAATFDTKVATSDSLSTKPLNVKVDYLLPDGALGDIPADIILYSKAFSSAAKNTDDLKIILDNCSKYVSAAVSRLDWVSIINSNQKSAYRDVFKNMLKKLLQRDLTSYYSGLDDSLKKQINDLLISADDDKPTYDLQIGLMDDLGKKITTVSQLTATSDLQKILTRLCFKIATNGGEQLLESLFAKVFSYYSKNAVPAIGLIGSSAADKKTLANWNIALMDRFVDLLTANAVTTENIDNKMSQLKDVCSQISKCAAAEQSALIKKISDAVLAKFAPIIKTSTAERVAAFKSILQQIDGLVVNSVNNIWKAAGISRLEGISS